MQRFSISRSIEPFDLQEKDPPSSGIGKAEGGAVGVGDAELAARGLVERLPVRIIDWRRGAAREPVGLKTKVTIIIDRIAQRRHRSRSRGHHDVGECVFVRGLCGHDEDQQRDHRMALRWLPMRQVTKATAVPRQSW